MLCSQCGQRINGKPVVTGHEGEFTYWEGDLEMVLERERDLNFCSHLCAWDYGIEEHEYYPMTDEEIRYHLISDHGLIPPAR